MSAFFLLVRCLYNKQSNTWLDISLVRYRVEHEKRNSISLRAGVLFSIYFSSIMWGVIAESSEEGAHVKKKQQTKKKKRRGSNK